MKLFAFLVLASALGAQTLSITCPSKAQAGSTITCTAALAAGGGITGIDAILGLPSSFALSSASIGASGTAAAKQFGANLSNGRWIVYDTPTTTFTDGIVATFSVTVPVSARGNFTLALTTAHAADANGNEVAVTVNPGASVSVSNRCDVNGDGLLNSADVAFMKDQFLGPQSLVFDLNGDGHVSIADVTIVELAVASGVCPVQ